ncbi:hypothetical protein ES703_104206 [subsurface metagenome]
MEIKNMEFYEYCCLNRQLLRVDERDDAHWFFGNKDPEIRLLNRINSDLNTKGVPKCGVIGRWGIGKTHTLNHLRTLFQSDPNKYKVYPVEMQLAPWDDTNSRGNNWGYIHRKMIDAIGEHYLRYIVVEFDQLPEGRTENLAKSMENEFKFGDANLRYSLSVVMADNFLREGRSTSQAWDWLRGEKVPSANLGANRNIETVQDMVDTVLNISILSKKATNMGIVFLIDEAHELNDVKKKRSEIHFGFKSLADQSNSDAGFVLAIFGSGMNAIPELLRVPDDILNRLGVTHSTLHQAIIELKDVTSEESDLKEFALSVLRNLKDLEKANSMISELSLESRTTPELIPFTSDGLDEIIKKLKDKEETKAPRLVIENLASTANDAYQEAKVANNYILVDAVFARKVLG